MIAVGVGTGAIVGGILGMRKKRSVPLNALWIGANGGLATWINATTKNYICDRNPKLTGAQASMMSGGLAGGLFGIVIAQNAFAGAYCSLGGVVVSLSMEALEARFMQYRLAWLLEQRNPELSVQSDNTSMHDRINAGKRPWYYPEWIPIQPTDAATEENINKKRIKKLKDEILRLRNENNDNVEGS